MSLNNQKETWFWRLPPWRFSLLFWPPTYFLPILLYHFCCFCHIVLWLPCVIHRIPTFPFHLVFPTCSLRAWSVVCDWLDDIPCTATACRYCRTWLPPGDYSIFCAITFEPADVDCVVDRHVGWDILFNSDPVYLENFVWTNVTLVQFASHWIDICVWDWQILYTKKYLHPGGDAGVNWTLFVMRLCRLLILGIVAFIPGDCQIALQSFNEFGVLKCYHWLHGLRPLSISNHVLRQR